MHYADRQLEHFLRALENEPWYKNTYVIILADHAFPLGENGVSTMNGGGFSNATWIPFLIHGEGIEIGNDTSTASQIDISPTLLELAGIVSPNMFMGHNLLRGYGNGLSLGAYSKVAAIGLENFRLIVRYPISENEIDGLFAEGDTRQEKNWAKENDQKVKYLKGALDSLIQISDYSLERGW